MNIYEKLQTARVRLQSQEIKKTGHNTYSNYFYMELGDFLPATQTLFQELKLFGAVSFTSEVATLTITDMEIPESTLVFTSPMGSVNMKGSQEVQNIGAVETYQRRYLWVTAMEIVEHDALDAVTGKDKQQEKHVAKEKQEKPIPVNAKEMEITLEMLSKGETMEEIQAVFAAIWKRATKDQQAVIKETYDKRKSQLTPASLGEQA